MTTIRKYQCNNCGDKIDSLSGVGFEFKSAGTELERHNLNQAENHLCYKCIVAIHNLSVLIFNNKSKEDK